MGNWEQICSIDFFHRIMNEYKKEALIARKTRNNSNMINILQYEKRYVFL
jgi:hypothetical protein